MRCIYCQNFPWSSEGAGTPYGIEDLAGIFRRLAEEGCHNWNLVSPTPWLPWIERALKILEEGGHRLPVVYNTSGFERLDTLDRAHGFVNIFLTDLRYSNERTAQDASGTSHYVETARRAMLKMWELAGPLQEKDGIAVRGTICRLLILPGHADEAVDNLRWLADHVGTDVAVSIMAQYVPAYKAVTRETWNRPIGRDEYDLVCGEAERLGFDNGWMQEFEGQTAPDLIGCRMKPGGHEDRED